MELGFNTRYMYLWMLPVLKGWGKENGGWGGDGGGGRVLTLE